MNSKQLIYLEIINLVLPFARNAQTWGLWSRLNKGNVYLELELIHNIPPLIRAQNFEVYDVYWVNIQAKNYFNQSAERPSYNKIVELITNLADICPEGLAGELDRDFIYRLNKYIDHVRNLRVGH
jgi:hypothetical protein